MDTISRSSSLPEVRTGLNLYTAGFIIVAQLGGAGFVSLPSALANTGWLGLPMMVLFAAMVAYSASKLALTWNLLEQRWPEQYAQVARQPYMDMAFRAYGIVGRRIAFFCVMVTQFGGPTVFIILIAQLCNTLVPSLSTCQWVLIVGALLTPCTWAGSPKDFWVGPVLAVVSTFVCVIVVVVEVIIESEGYISNVYFSNPTIGSFSLGFGAILFAFGGSSVFPTIQTDMTDRTQFWKSVVLGFSSILTLYIPLSVSGYAVYGTSVNANILFQPHKDPAISAAMALQVINLLGSYVIGFNTVSQAVEDIFDIPHHFNWKRVASRSLIVLSQVVICLAIPDFSLILNLIGGSCTTACTFILPPLMYLRLSQTGPEKTRIDVPLWSKLLLIQIVIVGCVGGVFSTISAFKAIIDNGFSESCFTDFN